MSGLMTSHLLSSVGFHHWKIIEASKRIGGRGEWEMLGRMDPEIFANT